MRTGSSKISFHLLLAGALAIASLTLGACAGRRLANETAHVAAAASPQMNCPQQNLSVRAIGNHQFQVQGCGLSATYQCQRGSGGYGYRRVGYRPGSCYMVGPLLRGGY
jgi:hypothetical protein